MNRRSFVVIASGGLTAVAGCLGLTSNNNTPETDDEPEEDTETQENEQESALDQATPVFHHPLSGDFSDEVNDVSGEPAESGVAFVEEDGKSVLELEGDGAGDSGGYYDIQYEEAAQYIREGDPVSISVWVKPENNQQWEGIFNGGGLTIDTRNGSVRCSWYNPSKGEQEFLMQAEATEYLPNGEWTHVVATLTPSEQAQFYINGEQVDSDDVDDDAGFRNKGNDVLRVGFHPTASDGAADNHFGGRIDDLRFYNGVLTSDAIQTLFEAR